MCVHSCMGALLWALVGLLASLSTSLPPTTTLLSSTNAHHSDRFCCSTEFRFISFASTAAILFLCSLSAFVLPLSLPFYSLLVCMCVVVGSAWHSVFSFFSPSFFLISCPPPTSPLFPSFASSSHAQLYKKSSMRSSSCHSVNCLQLIGLLLLGWVLWVGLGCEREWERELTFAFRKNDKYLMV